MDSRDEVLYLIGKEIGIKYDVFDTNYVQRFLFQKLIYVILQTEQFVFLYPGLYGVDLSGVYSKYVNEFGYFIQKNKIYESDIKFKESGISRFIDAVDSLPEFIIDIIVDWKLNGVIDEQAMQDLNSFCSIFFQYRNLYYIGNKNEEYIITKSQLKSDINITDEVFDKYYGIAELFYEENKKCYEKLI